MSTFPFAERQFHRSNSATFGVEQGVHAMADYSRHSAIDGSRLQRTVSHCVFEPIVEESQQTTEKSSSQPRYSQSSVYRQTNQESMGPWQKKQNDTNDSVMESTHDFQSEAQPPQQAQVKNAIKALKNYQLNVVVDLKDVLVGEEDEQQEDAPRMPMQEITANIRPRYKDQQEKQLSKDSSMNSLAGLRKYTDTDITWKKKLNSSAYEGTAALADKYRNLEKSYFWLKTEIGKLQQRQKGEADEELPQKINRSYWQQSKPIKYPYYPPTGGSYLNRTQTNQNRELAAAVKQNNQLKQQMEELYKLNRSYKRQADLCLTSAQSSQDQIEQLRREMDEVSRQNQRLRELYECSVAFAEELQRKPEQPKTDSQEVLKLKGYISELEQHIESENQAKEKFMEEIIGYKMNYQSLEEENKSLREQVRSCQVQHGTTEDWAQNRQPTEVQANQDYVSPQKRYSIPRLVISPPDEELL